MEHFKPESDDDLLVWVDQLRRYRCAVNSDLSKAEADQLGRRLLHDFCLRHWHGVTQNQHTMDWIVDAIGDVLDHQSAETAFSLSARPKSRPKGAVFDPLPIAAWCKLAVQRGYTTDEAEEAAASLFNCSPRTANRYRLSTVFNPEVDLEEFLLTRKNPKPLPSPKR